MTAVLGPSDRPLLVYALSGLGKSELCRRHPAHTMDTDEILDAVLAPAFPDESRTGRRIAWRALARSEPWRAHESADFHRWARIRRALVAGIVAALEDERPRLVLTNMILVPWPYAAYYGVTLGHYMEHWSRLERPGDNQQDEWWNSQLEGFHPLVRMPPGTFLSERQEVLDWLAAVRERTSR